MHCEMTLGRLRVRRDKRVGRRVEGGGFGRRKR